MNKDLANERAEYAFRKVSEIDSKPEDFQKYRSLVRSFPAMILNNGYGLAMAFIYSKINDNVHCKTLYEHIEDWFKEQNMLPNEDKVLIRSIANSDKDAYRLLESETLALLEWLKRFVEGAGAV